MKTIFTYGEMKTIFTYKEAVDIAVEATKKLDSDIKIFAFEKVLERVLSHQTIVVEGKE